uniref:THAP-type domain-containing protein n=1 Tax=Erpetoichthys calabaricus TaxID=27687 RepID=A0A8C4SB28_ERPCA
HKIFCSIPLYDHCIFPKASTRRKQWILAVSRQTPDNKLWEPQKRSFLCSKHFKPDMFDRTGQTVRLRDYAVPTEFDFSTSPEVGYFNLIIFNY